MAADAVSFMFLSPLGERPGEGVKRQGFPLHHPLTNLSPKGERSMKR
ncbi:hypothetical protein BH11PSE3_BH11PSE3_41670 [soil metagenome]